MEKEDPRVSENALIFFHFIGEDYKPHRKPFLIHFFPLDVKKDKTT